MDIIQKTLNLYSQCCFALIFNKNNTTVFFQFSDLKKKKSEESVRCLQNKETFANNFYLQYRNITTQSLSYEHEQCRKPKKVDSTKGPLIREDDCSLPVYHNLLAYMPISLSSCYLDPLTLCSLYVFYMTYSWFRSYLSQVYMFIVLCSFRFNSNVLFAPLFNTLLLPYYKHTSSSPFPTQCVDPFCLLQEMLLPASTICTLYNWYIYIQLYI